MGQARQLSWQIAPKLLGRLRREGPWGPQVPASPTQTTPALPPWAFLAVALSACAPMMGDCPCVQEEKKPLKEGVQDMLVKHHLFSWDIDG